MTADHSPHNSPETNRLTVGETLLIQRAEEGRSTDHEHSLV